jgi:hypothetical protein
MIRTCDFLVRRAKQSDRTGQHKAAAPIFSNEFDHLSQPGSTPSRHRLSVICQSVFFTCIRRGSQSSTDKRLTKRPDAASNRWFASAALVPEGKNLDPLRIRQQPVIHVVTNSRELNAPNTCQRYVQCASTCFRLNRNDRGGAFEFFSDSVRRLCSIETPPGFSSANLRLGEIADVDVELWPHSRLRISARTSFSGVV